MEPTKFRIRLAAMELDYEGSEAFLKNEVRGLISELAKLGPQLPIQVSQAAMPSGPSRNGAHLANSNFDHSTNTIASIIEAKTGPDLTMAAAAHLALSKGHDKFTRRELLEEMQTATTFYNQGYSGNFTKILNSLTKAKRLNLVGNQTYALTRTEREGFASRLSAEI